MMSLHHEGSRSSGAHQLLPTARWLQHKMKASSNDPIKARNESDTMAQA